jgi:signal peptidase II
MNLKKIIPFSLSVFVILVDQITKALVVKNIDFYTVKYSFFGDFIRIVHVRNKAIAFSLGYNLPEFFRVIAFSILPCVILILLVIYLIKTNNILDSQRWFFAGIAGGGFGNLIDRFFRSAGVVDFIDVKFFGFFGLERWPTFNIADSSIIIFGFLLFLSLFFDKKKNNRVY